MSGTSGGLVVGSYDCATTDVVQANLDFTEWLGPGELLTAVASCQAAVQLSGWIEGGPYPPTPPADPTPLQVTYEILPGSLGVQLSTTSGTPGNAYQITVVAVGESTRRITVCVNVQLKGTPPTVVGTPPSTVNQALAAQAAAAVVMAAGAMPLVGGAFLGPVTLTADPTAPLGAATKEYVDNLLSGAGSGVATETARAEAAEATLTTNLAAEVTNRGTAITSAVATETTRAGAAEATDGHPTHRAKSVARFVAAQEGQLALFFLPPYSPELNPDEYVWNDLKAHGTGRQMITSLGQLRQMILSHMRQLQKLPALVRSFFHAPTTRYARV